MPVALTTPITPPSNQPDINRVKIEAVNIKLLDKVVMIVMIDQNDDGEGAITDIKTREKSYTGTDASAIFTAATNTENLRKNLQRVLFEKMQADGTVGAGTIS